MTNGEEVRTEETSPNNCEQEQIQQRPRPPLRTGVGSSQTSDSLTGLGKLLEQVLTARTNDEHSIRN